MANNLVRDESYITILGWMVTRLNLKGNELLVYAMIYGFSQTENQNFTGSLNYFASWTNSTKRGIIKTLQALEEKKLIEKIEKYVNSVKFCEYRAIPVVFDKNE